MFRPAIVAVVASVAPLLLLPGPVHGQPLGTFRWQLHPYCNVITVAVTQKGAVYSVEGTDDQCGSNDRASAIGTAFSNPDGSIGLGLTIVSSPGATPVHVDATLNLPDLGGTWRDSAGNAGSLVLTSGAGTGGSPRPTMAALIGASAVDATEIQLRVGGSCPGGQSVRAVNQDGSVACAAPPTGGVTRILAGTGLEGGGDSGEVTIGVRTTATGAFDFSNSRGFVAAAPFGATGYVPVEGAGKRLLWYPGRAAFRAGEVSGSQWDDVRIGGHSTAMGENTVASGPHSTAFGLFTTASGDASTAAGVLSTASGRASVALGNNATAAGLASVAIGESTFAMGDGSVALGYRARAPEGSFVFADRSSGSTFAALGPNQFKVRAAGGVGFYTHPALLLGVELHAGSGSWSNVSDVNVKENFRGLDGESVLDKLARMPVRSWNYKAQAPTIRHIGPTAQDFKAAFGLGETDRLISSVDADGIALAAAKALEARTRALIEENEALSRENDALRERIERLERTTRQISRSRR